MTTSNDICSKCEKYGDDCGEHLPSWEELANRHYEVNKSLTAENAVLRARVEWLEKLLNGRDEFIVGEDLWDKFCRWPPALGEKP